MSYNDYMGVGDSDLAPGYKSEPELVQESEPKQTSLSDKLKILGDILKDNGLSHLLDDNDIDKLCDLIDNVSNPTIKIPKSYPIVNRIGVDFLDRFELIREQVGLNTDACVVRSSDWGLLMRYYSINKRRELSAIDWINEYKDGAK